MHNTQPCQQPWLLAESGEAVATETEKGAGRTSPSP